MLRQDTHPPLYYTLLWGWGNLVGQSPVSLRLLSWLAYLAGGVVMVAQSVTLADGRRQVVPLAVLLAFCSPYPIRFAIEDKSYALLVFLVALAWWWRRAQRPALYGITAALAGLTHFYGLFLMLAAAIWDGLQSRRRLALAGLMAGLPALAWIGYAADYLFSSRSGSWIGSPDFALLEETLARGLGLWPLPKLAVLVLLIWGLRRWGGMAALRWPDRDMLDLSGLIPSGIMVVAVVLVSFIKPLAFSRYFVVLLPALVPVIASLSSRVSFNISSTPAAALVAGQQWSSSRTESQTSAIAATGGGSWFRLPRPIHGSQPCPSAAVPIRCQGPSVISASAVASGQARSRGPQVCGSTNSSMSPRLGG